MEFEKPSPKLLIVAGIFLASVLAFSYLLGSSLATITFPPEGFLSYLPVLVCFFLASGLAIVFALLTERVIGILGFSAAAFLFCLPLTLLPIPWRLGMGAIFFVGLLLSRTQARAAHEAHTGFSAFHYRGTTQTLFFFFTFVLVVLLFLFSRRALGRQDALVPSETLESLVYQAATVAGGVLSQQAPGEVTEKELAPAVEQMLIEILRMVKLNLQLEGEPTSLAEAATRISGALEAELADATTLIKPYIPFVLAGIALVTLMPLAPFIIPVGVLIFLVVYQSLILVRLLKFEEVERTVKRLALN